MMLARLATRICAVVSAATCAVTSPATWAVIKFATCAVLSAATCDPDKVLLRAGPGRTMVWRVFNATTWSGELNKPVNWELLKAVNCDVRNAEI